MLDTSLFRQLDCRAMNDIARWKLIIRGTVQGVGFRPFIYRLALRHQLSGCVQNTASGVQVEVQGPHASLALFIDQIRQELPPLACIHDMEMHIIEILSAENDFSIISSNQQDDITTIMPPDIAPCDDCLAEMLDRNDRRYHYPFINCTNCGPRYSIIQGLPYDRSQTTMQDFKLCQDCQREYEDPSNRRFHAQPNACPECGPKVEFVLSDTNASRKPGNPIDLALEALAQGKIIAIKGIGGFHLACDATNASAVQTLRERKRRDEKPFACMVKHHASARAFCDLSPSEEHLLSAAERPIVLVEKKLNTTLAANVAPNNSHLGLMFPSSPLHHLLFEAARKELILVMTSGNISNEPMISHNEEALEKLSSIADAFLLHNRDIFMRIDDSIIRLLDEKPLMLRRARGYTPSPIKLGFTPKPIIAFGADLKATIGITMGSNACLSHYIGDLEHLETGSAYAHALERFTETLKFTPCVAAFDSHPQYFSTGYAKAFAFKHHDIETVEVQHHHAHIASCMLENDLPNEPIIGIALDGTGFGMDGTVWGGEILIADYTDFDRAGQLSKIMMPGGNSAAKEPWRMALSALYHTLHLTEPSNIRGLQLFENIDEESLHVVWQMLEKKLNAPFTSSCGRLFDAASALILGHALNAFEGQAAMALEQAANSQDEHCYEIEIHDRMQNRPCRDNKRDPLFEIDTASFFKGILADIDVDTPARIISKRFHNSLSLAFAKTALHIAEKQKLPRKAVLSGGCFQNVLLTKSLIKKLEEYNFDVYTHSLVPPNDGGITLGQMAIAGYRTQSS
jgi:hydrogenase maturation protein HypF